MATLRMLTPAATGGISSFEIEGANLLSTLAPFSHPAPGNKLGNLQVCTLRNEHQTIDEIIIAIHDIRPDYERLRLHCHGGPAVRQAVMDFCIALGWTYTTKPCTTDTSFSGKALQSLPAATTRAGAYSLLAQGQGKIEAFLTTFAAQCREAHSKENLLDSWDRYLQRSRVLLRLLHPVNVVLAGKPNAGKSSLYNALLGLDRSLVSSRPGTTIDSLQTLSSFDQVPVLLTDIPGYRTDGQQNEEAGIKLAEGFLQDAGLILYLIDSTVGKDSIDDSCIQLFDSSRHLVIYTKKDLLEVHVSSESEILISSHSETDIQNIRERITAYLTEELRLPIVDAALFLQTDYEHARILRDRIASNPEAASNEIEQCLEAPLHE